MIEISKNINTLGQTFSSVDPDSYSKFKSSNDRDVFEKVIDDLMVERYTNDPDIKEYIKSLPNEKKRVAILSLIGEDNALWSKINDLLKEKKTGYQRLKDIYFLLRDYVKIADVERKKHGEILTPFKELAEPMVKLVEKYDPEFWKNPNHKVLDSSAGYGTFLILSAYKFMVGLKDWEPDEEKRFKWVVENCLYYGELQAKSAFSWLVAIDPYDEYKTNTYYGSFLTEDFDRHAKEVWGVEKWNAIIQNPPYQMRKDGFKKTQPLWHLFVHKSLDLLKEGGYMVMVHPSGWRNVDGIFKDTQNLLKKYQILYLSIQNEKEGLKIFGAETRYDYYILKKLKDEIVTKIRCQDGVEDIAYLRKMEFIPNGSLSEISSLISNENQESVKILHSYSSYETRKNWVSKNIDSDYKYPIIYTVKSGDIPNIWYSSRNTNGHFGIPKLIWSNFRISSAGSIIDRDGEYGLTQFSYAIVDEIENLEYIKKAFDSKKFRKLMEECSVSDMSINRKIIATFKKDFWKYFLNVDDIFYSEENLKSKVLEIGCGVSYKMFGSTAYPYGDKYLKSSTILENEIFDRISKILNGNKNSYISDLNIDNSLVDKVDRDRFIELDILKFDPIDLKFDRIHLRLVMRHIIKLTNLDQYENIFKKLFLMLEENGSVILIEDEFYFEIKKDDFENVRSSFDKYKNVYDRP